MNNMQLQLYKAFAWIQRCSCNYISIYFIEHSNTFNIKDMQLHLYSYAPLHSVIYLFAEFDQQLQLYTYYHYFEVGSLTEYILTLCISILWIHKAVAVIQSQL